MKKSRDIECLSVAPTISVAGILDTIEYYRTKLGFRQLFVWGEPPTHGAVALGDASVHFALGDPGPQGFWLYFHIEDADELYAWYRHNGVDLMDEPKTIRGECANSTCVISTDTSYGLGSPTSQEAIRFRWNVSIWMRE